jgi:hypothetical protein
MCPEIPKKPTPERGILCIRDVTNQLQPQTSIMATLVSNPFSGTAPIKQHHRNGCWAACLEWWSRCVLGCTGYTQDGIRANKEVKSMYKSDSSSGKKFSTKSKKYGTLETHKLMGLLQSSPWYLHAEKTTQFSGTMLQTRLSSGPVFIGFYDLSGNTWHVNIICNYDSSFDMAVVMEPRNGKFLDKSLSDFTMAAPDGAQFNVLGWRV